MRKTHQADPGRNGQLWFSFVDDPAYKKAEKSAKALRPYTPHKAVNYERIYERLLQGPVTAAEIREMTGLSRSGTSQAIDTLCVNYPVWSPRRGLYKLMGKDDDQWV